MVLIFLTMRGIRGHYDRVTVELEIDESDHGLPSHVHAIVLVSKLHKPALRAVLYARASRPTAIEALTVDTDPEVAQRLQEEWNAPDLKVPLRILSSPYREVLRPIVAYVRHIRRDSPLDIVTVYIPEYVVGHWWERLLHNQTAWLLKARHLFTPGVMVTRSRAVARLE